MNWLITGGCGFIGRNLVARLVEEGGHAIRVVDNLSVGSREDLAAVSRFSEVGAAAASSFPTADLVQLVAGDILDADLALRVAAGAEVIVHLAANTGVAPSVENPRADCVTNVIGTLNYLEAARHASVKRFVFASSGAPIGECIPPIHEELAPHPVSPYGASKLAGEGYCSAYFRSFGVETVALRFGNVYGPRSGHKSSVVAQFIRNALAGAPLEIYGDGGQTRDFIFVDDLTDAIVRAAAAFGVGGEIFQIASNAETTVSEVAATLINIVKESGIAVPQIRHSATRVGDVRRNFSDTTKAKARLGWSAQTDLQNGLKQTLDWFVEMSGLPAVASLGAK